MKHVHVHFVCTGNVYRSRLAEAYLRSKQLPNIEVSSSGIQASENTHGPITWYAARIARRHNLIPHLKLVWTQTSPKLLNNADIVVFMTSEHHAYAKTHFDFGKTSYEIWNIADLDKANFFRSKDDSDLMRIEHTEEVFMQIKQKVDKLATKLRSMIS